MNCFQANQNYESPKTTESWTRVENSDPISLSRKGISEYFRLFMLKMRWKICLPQKVIVSNGKFIMKNIQTGRDSNISLTLATWSPGLVSFFITDIRYKKGDKKAPGSRLWYSQKKTFPVLGYFSDFKREFYRLVFVTKLLKYWNTCPIHPPVGTAGITDFLKPSYNQTSATPFPPPPCALYILLSKFITRLMNTKNILTTQKILYFHV